MPLSFHSIIYDDFLNLPGKEKWATIFFHSSLNFRDSLFK
jgi:hypothetical protein